MQMVKMSNLLSFSKVLFFWFTDSKKLHFTSASVNVGYWFGEKE
jgi:hypothetical protein